MAARDIDVGAGCMRIEREQVGLPDGHLVKDNVMILVIPNSIREAFYIDRTYDFNCPKMATSWYFRIAFVRHLKKAASCMTSIRRSGEGTGMLNVQFGVTIRINNRRFDDVRVKHMVFGMTSGQNDTEVFETVIGAYDAERLYGQELPVEFYLTVHGCHSAQEMTRSLGCLGREKTKAIDDSEDSPVIKRLRVQSPF